MEANLVQFSTVVTGKAHNPTLLNPDFLAATGIVDKSWGWKIEETITTPPFAMVRYTCGVSVTVEFDKLQVTDVNIGDDPTKSRAAAIATAYVETLPHIRYSGVGTNIQSVVESDSPALYLRERYIKQGAWHSSKRPLDAVGIRLMYPLQQEGRVTLSLDSGEAEQGGQDERRKVVIVNANFHRECGEPPNHEIVVEHLKKVGADWTTYCDLVSDAITE